MVAEIWASVMSSFVDQLVALIRVLQSVAHVPLYISTECDVSQ